MIQERQDWSSCLFWHLCHFMHRSVHLLEIYLWGKWFQACKHTQFQFRMPRSAACFSCTTFLFMDIWVAKHEIPYFLPVLYFLQTLVVYLPALWISFHLLFFRSFLILLCLTISPMEKSYLMGHSLSCSFPWYSAEISRAVWAVIQREEKSAGFYTMINNINLHCSLQDVAVAGFHSYVFCWRTWKVIGCCH